MSSRIKKNLDFYLSLKYPVTIHQDTEGGFVAEILDLPGCMTQAETIDELMSAIDEAKRAWVTAAYEMGQDIPIPGESDEFKGKVLLRISRSLHRELTKAAELQGLSLNQYASNILAAGVHGDLLKQQVVDLLEKITPKVAKPSYDKGTVFGNNTLPMPREDLVKLKGTRAFGVN